MHVQATYLKSWWLVPGATPGELGREGWATEVGERRVCRLCMSHRKWWDGGSKGSVFWGERRKQRGGMPPPHKFLVGPHLLSSISISLIFKAFTHHIHTFLKNCPSSKALKAAPIFPHHLILSSQQLSWEAGREWLAQGHPLSFIAENGGLNIGLPNSSLTHKPLMHNIYK